MGYFIVSGASKSIITLDARDLPSEYRVSFEKYKECMNSTLIYQVNNSTNYDRFFSRILPRWNMVFVRRLWDTALVDTKVIGLVTAPAECTVCEGTTERPENW